MTATSLSDRSSGILLHPTSLPSAWGIGDLGPEAFRFIADLHASGQHWWQMLPIGPIGAGHSPYDSPSAFAGNPLLISPDLLVQEGLLTASERMQLPRGSARRVRYEELAPSRERMLRQCYRRFSHHARASLRLAYQSYCRNQKSWIEDFALFSALKDVYSGASWMRWPKPLRQRETSALRRAAHDLSESVDYYKFVQFLFDRQWRSLKQQARKNNIGLIGDVAIFVSQESADVWANQPFFRLNDDASPKVVAGVPPDYFSRDGQRWGNPLYDWTALRRENYRWWIHRLRKALHRFDAVRLDHFIGFTRFWEIPARAPTARTGRYVPGPGAAFFEALQQALGKLPLIAEDLGVVTPAVKTLRDRFDLPGMRVLQFAFGDDPEAEHYQPHRYPRRCVVYTGTHDNDTTVGWFRDRGGPQSTRSAKAIHRERRHALNYLGTQGREIHWDMIRLALSSVAELAILPFQDLLGLGSGSRMNRPGVETGNWEWRMTPRTFTVPVQRRLRDLTALYGRLG